MSGKRKADNSEVFAALKGLLLPQNEAQEVVLDFEAVMWAGICDTFPEKRLRAVCSTALWHCIGMCNLWGFAGLP